MAIANDGNLLPRPLQVTSVRLSVAEPYDIIIDFNQVKSLIGSHTKVRLENRLPQDDGRAPRCDIFAGGKGTSCVEFQIGAAATDNSVDPASQPFFYALPTVVTPRITRTFEFNRDNGQWTVNSRFADCNELRFAITQGSAENWILHNSSGGWQHPIHVHLELFQILKRSSGDCRFRGGGAGISAFRPNVPNVEVSRKDTARLGFGEDITLFSRFRDFVGDWPMHCHNTLHEDHAMMLLFQVRPGVTDNNRNP